MSKCILQTRDAPLIFSLLAIHGLAPGPLDIQPVCSSGVKPECVYPDAT